jgi:hypothetical protein
MDKALTNIEMQSPHQDHVNCSVKVDSDLKGGFCETHSQSVSHYRKCPLFNFNNAMWIDLWDMGVKQLKSRRERNY